MRSTETTRQNGRQALVQLFGEQPTAISLYVVVRHRTRNNSILADFLVLRDNQPIFLTRALEAFAACPVNHHQLAKYPGLLLLENQTPQLFVSSVAAQVWPQMPAIQVLEL